MYVFRVRSLILTDGGHLGLAISIYQDQNSDLKSITCVESDTLLSRTVRSPATGTGTGTGARHTRAGACYHTAAFSVYAGSTPGADFPSASVFVFS